MKFHSNQGSALRADIVERPPVAVSGTGLGHHLRLDGLDLADGDGQACLPLCDHPPDQPAAEHGQRQNDKQDYGKKPHPYDCICDSSHLDTPLLVVALGTLRVSFSLPGTSQDGYQNGRNCRPCLTIFIST